MKLSTALVCVMTFFGANVAFAAEPQQEAAKQIEVRGSWIGRIAGIDQSFVITQSNGGVLSGYGAANGYTWTVTGKVRGDAIHMEWPYNELAYTATFDATLPKSGKRMLDGTWTDTNENGGKWNAVRAGTDDTFYIRGTAKKPGNVALYFTLAKREINGSFTAIEQIGADKQGSYEFLIDVEGQYVVEGSLGFCVDGPSACKRQSKVFAFKDSGSGKDQIKTVDFMRDK